MNFFLSFPIHPLKRKLKYDDKILMIGSCFSTEIGDRLAALKFNIIQNPTGIIYHPLVIAHILNRILEQKKFQREELFEHNGIWNSWDHHSSLSGPDADCILDQMNSYLDTAYNFLKHGDFLFLTPATAFGYFLKDEHRLVANCHKMPSGIFEKRLTGSKEISEQLFASIKKIKSFNPNLTIIITVSPVRHYRDGVVANSISKSHVVTAIHEVISYIDGVYYFPSYEILNDELRDYRFYKSDFAHPNEAAIKYIFERFVDFSFGDNTKALMNKISEIISDYNHRPKFPQSAETKFFAHQSLKKISDITANNSFLDFSREINHFEHLLNVSDSGVENRE